MADALPESLRHRTPGERSGVCEEVQDGLTGRAFLIGLALCLFLAVVIPYNRMVIQGTSLHYYFVDRGILFVFLLLVLFCNVVLKPAHRLKRGELLCIFSMLLVSMPALWMVKWLIAFLTGATYYASPERPDLEAVLPHILPWTAPRNAEAVRGFYEGLPDGVPLPWLAWLAPLASWGSFFLVLFGVLLCIAVIFRRQWSEHERFAFPILQVPLEMTETDAGRLGPLFRNRLMWAGFAVPLLIGTVNGLNHYFHTVPRVQMGTLLWIFQGTTPLPLRMHFAILGYSYFVNLDVSLSIWVFNVISKVIRGTLAVFGAEYTDVSGMVGRFSSRGSSFLALTGMGYMLVLAAYSAWTARGHLRGVFARAFGTSSTADDSGEVISYRAAVFGTLGGLIYLGCWLHQAGMSLALILFLFFSSIVVFFVLARIVSETGFVATYSPINPAEFVVCATGSSAFGPAGLVTLGFGYAWTMTRVSNVMPRALGALWLSRGMRRKRGLIWAMGAAMAVGLVTASAMTLDLGYARGGLNLDRHFRDYSRIPFDAFVGTRMLEPSPVFTKGILYTGLGMGIAGLLTLLRMRLRWWPLHPVALPLSTIWYTDTYFFSVFLAWWMKATVLKFGGATLYRRTRPLFMGIILGEATGAGVWCIVDYFSGTIGNRIFI